MCVTLWKKEGVEEEKKEKGVLKIQTILRQNCATEAWLHSTCVQVLSYLHI